MERTEILTVVQELAAEVLGVDESAVVESARFKEDLDADSLDLVELVMALEERLEVAVPEEDLAALASVGDAVDLLLGKVSASA
jgi:acyl carrier protein